MTLHRRKQMRLATKRYYHRQALANRAAGLTARGRKPKRRAWTELGNIRGHDRRIERQRRTRAANIRAGLNHRGQPRTRRARPELAGLHGKKRHNKLCRLLHREKLISPIETAWRAERATMGVLEVAEASGSVLPWNRN